MRERITESKVMNALASYVETLERTGHYVPREGYRVAFGRPYGHLYYVYTTTGGDNRHDVPGFQGSGSSPFETPREAYEAITRCNRLLGELAYPVTDMA